MQVDTKFNYPAGYLEEGYNSVDEDSYEDSENKITEKSLRKMLLQKITEGKLQELPVKSEEEAFSLPSTITQCDFEKMYELTYVLGEGATSLVKIGKVQ
jgi:hypothetical protein